MSNKFKALERIGISADEAKLIKNYSLRQQGNSDVLKIYFKRKPHDLIAHNRKYVFERVSKRVLVDGGRQIFEEVFEISPFINQLTTDLGSLKAESVHFSSGKQKILEDLEHLKLVVDRKIEEIEQELKDLNK